MVEVKGIKRREKANQVKSMDLRVLKDVEILCHLLVQRDLRIKVIFIVFLAIKMQIDFDIDVFSKSDLRVISLHTTNLSLSFNDVTCY